MKTYKTKPLEIFFEVNGEVFPYATIYKNTNNHKFEAVKNYFKIDIFDFKDAIDNFGDLHFWDIRQRYNYILDKVEDYMYQIFQSVLFKKNKENADDNIHLLRFDITLRVDNTDKIIRRWFTVHKGCYINQPSEVVKINSKYNELNSTVINEINNLIINDDKNAALLVDTLMEDWRSHHR